MRPNLINAGALQDVVGHALEGAPPAIQGQSPGIGAYIRRAAEQHDSVRKARRRRDDPAWAQAKFNEGCPLYRFREDDRETLLSEIRRSLRELEKVAELAADGKGPCAREAAAYLRGLTHQRPSFRSLRIEVRSLLRQARRAALCTRKDEVLRPPAEVSAGALIGKRCVSVKEIINLGNGARNCLAHNETYWEDFVSGSVDIWGLRKQSRLVAVLRVKRDENCIVEAKGPGNAAIGLLDARDVALFARVASLTIDGDCDGLLLDYAEPLLVEPKVVLLGREVALYAEWPAAVRIDLSDKDEPFPFGNGSRIKRLVLSFDSARPLAMTILDGTDPRDAVEAFGRKALRQIVRSVALEQTTPSLVQHRLLALAS